MTPTDRPRAPRVQLAGLAIADSPARWRALGFAVDGEDRVLLGGVELALGVGGHGITRWTLRHAPPVTDVDGLATSVTDEKPRTAAGIHPNGATGVDHVVIVTPDFDASAAALAEHDLALRRIRRADDRRQGFRRLGPTIMELVEAPDAPATAFWGLTIVVVDLEAVARAHDVVGAVRPAVQPGRRIAAVGRAAGLTTRLALIDPQ
jgi:hypothetical protein